MKFYSILFQLNFYVDTARCFEFHYLLDLSQNWQQPSSLVFPTFTKRKFLSLCKAYGYFCYTYVIHVPNSLSVYRLHLYVNPEPTIDFVEAIICISQLVPHSETGIIPVCMYVCYSITRIQKSTITRTCCCRKVTTWLCRGLWRTLRRESRMLTQHWSVCYRMCGTLAPRLPANLAGCHISEKIGQSWSLGLPRSVHSVIHTSGGIYIGCSLCVLQQFYSFIDCD